jgi:ABC-type thiamine transport system substrate-binding protein
MRSRLAVFLIVGASAVFALLFARQLRLSRGLPHESYAEKSLKLLTYSSFVSANGPGPSLIKEFEKTCGCKVDVIAVSDAGLLLERLKVGGADLVVGLDQLLLPAARQDFAWQSLEAEDTDWEEPVAKLATD